MSGFEGEYNWVVGVAGVVAFICAFGIGANDLANSFGSSVATKALTMWQCVLIAGVCEFTGAFFLGAGVTDTIKSGIADVKVFSSTPELLMWGMFCVMIAGAFWDNMACHLGMPVSTTHTTIGAIVGMSLTTYGKEAVLWWRICKASNNYCDAKKKGNQNFPVKGFGAIIMSWVFSPVCAGILVSIFYYTLRLCVLRSRHSFFRALFLLPWCVGFTFALITAFVIQTGAKNATWEDMSDSKITWISVTVGASFIILSYLTVVPLLYRQVTHDEEKHDQKLADKERAIEEGNKQIKGESQEEKNLRIAEVMRDINAANRDPIGERFGAMFNKFKETRAGAIILDNILVRTITYGATYDVHQSALQDDHVTAIWANAEIFDYKTERLFRYLQIFSAMVMSFAHGSNDVANAMGPFSAVYYIYKNGQVPKKSPVPNWILALGGAGIVTGLATYGYHITRVIGVKAVKLTNTRGFCAELATAFVVVIASRFGLPISTTQTIVGAIFAIGLFEGTKGVNWRVLANVFFGWVLTFIVAGFIGAGFQAFGIFSPHKQTSISISYVSTKVIKPDVQHMIDQLFAIQADSQTYLAFNKTLSTLTKVPFNLDKIVNLQSSVLATFNESICLT